MSILDEIVSLREKPVIHRIRNKQKLSLIKTIENTNEKGRIGLIAELKPKAPSLDYSNKSYSLRNRISIYEKNGASGISVLTEQNYFGGTVKNLIIASEVSSLPLLRKDFITNLSEIKDSKNINADVVLLITTLLQERLEEFILECKKHQLEALVEVHTKKEIKLALDAGATLIGINNRNLQTLQTNLSVTKKLVPLIPEEIMTISESGIKTVEDVKKVASWGVQGILVGTAFMTSSNLQSVVRQMAEVTL